jgi:hypothetical protein
MKIEEKLYKEKYLKKIATETTKCTKLNLATALRTLTTRRHGYGFIEGN